MAQGTELERLEDFVARLLDRFNALQAEKKRVDELLAEKEEAIVGLQDELAALKDERGMISNRVSGLLDRIEEWEAGVGVEEPVSSRNEGVVQGTLF